MEANKINYKTWSQKAPENKSFDLKLQYLQKLI